MSAVDDIWTRVMLPDRPDLPPELSKYVLGLGFTDADQRRTTDLSRKANRGTLTEAERRELEAFVMVGHVLAMLQAKARLSLRDRSTAV